MRIKILFFIITGLLLSASLFPCSAQEIAGESAQLDNIIYDNYSDLSVSKSKDGYNFIAVKLSIKSILEKYNSPLVDSAESFTKTCQKYEISCFLLPSIAGLESTFGKFILPTSYNPFGWGRGEILFDSWAMAIDAVGKGLREKYIDKGALNLEQIGVIYSESSTWTPRVAYFMNVFEQKYDEYQLNFPNE